MPYIKEGTLFRRSNGRWEARLMINGKQVYIACCKRQEDALKKLNNAVELKRKNKFEVKEIKNETLHEYLDFWYKVFQLPKEGDKLKTSTLKTKKYEINTVKRNVPDKALKDLTGIYIQECLNKMTFSRARLTVYRILNEALKKAKEKLKTNVMDMVDKPFHEELNGRELQQFEIDSIYKACKNQFEKDFITFYLKTGIRPEELHVVKTTHIDFNRNEIFIDGTKTKTSSDFIPIMKGLKEVLIRLLKLTKNDNLFNLTNYARLEIYHSLKKNSKVDFELKDLRHTFATKCKDDGIPLEVYSKWMRHSTTKITKKVYTHKNEKDHLLSQEWAKNFK